MAKLADLVVGIGLNTKQLNKDLGKARREFKRLGSNFKALGRDLTRNVSLPLAALGAAAIKSAADLERLEVSFISLTGGAEQAAKMMDQLNKFTAETPFQIEGVADAAKKLLASGTDVSKVNQQLQFLGDIAATGGHRIEDLTAIFAKVNAKGKVELESLNQLAERGIPIFKALSDATGLLPSELGAGAVSVEQFNETLASFAKEGGFAHGAMERLSQTASGQFSTALDALKLAGADLMKDVLPVVTQLIAKITELAKGFMGLSDRTKELILNTGLFVAALGPLLSILPRIVQGLELIKVASIATSGTIGTLGNAMSVAFGVKTIKNLRSLVKVKQLLITGLQRIPYVAAGAFAFAGIKHAIDEINTATEAIRRYNEHKRIMLGLEKETAKFLEGENTRLANQSAAIKGTSKNIEDYTSTLEVLTLENARFWQAYESGETALAQTEGSVKLSKQAYDLLKETMEGMIPMASDMLPHALEEVRAKLEEKIKTLSRTTEAYEQLSHTVELAGQEFELFESGQLLGFLNDFYDASITASEGVTAITEKLNELRDASGPAMQQATQNVEGFALESSAQLLDFLDDYQVTAQQTVDMTNSLSSGMETLGGMIAQTFQGLIDGSIEGKDALRILAKQIIAAAVAQAISNAVANASSSLNAENQLSAGKTIGKHMIIALGSVAAGLAAMPAFAQGGIVYGPGMAMVGDNRNAGLDPEVIAPLSKLERIMGGRATQVYGRISGDDIVISNDRATRDRNRYE